MTCFDKKDTVVSQLANNLFVAIHVPKNSLTIECPLHEVYNITEEVEYGSLRIITNCSCTIRLHKKTIGRSTGPVCQGHESVTIDVLLPGKIVMFRLLKKYVKYINTKKLFLCKKVIGQH